jgi:hypothetical protein
MPISRKRFLEGASWTTAGAALGFLGRPLVVPPPAQTYSPPPFSQPTPQPPPPPVRQKLKAVVSQESFSQCGEDLNIAFTLRSLLFTGKLTYLDIGANDPIDGNNTYFFYQLGYRGVLVEPNPAFEECLKSERPRDTTLVAGIGVTAERELDFYVMSAPALSTFSK